jgi:hypothetical protein
MIVLGHISKKDEPPRREDRNAPWMCQQVMVKDILTGNTYNFPINETLILDKEPKLYKGKLVKESIVSKTKALDEISYEVTVFTGSESSGSTSNQLFKYII